MRVIISGAGIAGPPLAYFLAKTGAHVTIVEKSPSLRAQGQNIDMAGSAITVVKTMGLMEEIRRFNTTEAGTTFINGKGKPFAPFPVREGALSPTAEFEILRGDLANVLYEASKDHPNVTYLFGTTISEVIANDDNVVKVALSNGDVREYDLAVAADGMWSPLRKKVFATENITVVDKKMYTAYWTVPRVKSDNDYWNIFWALGSRTIATRPDPYGTIRAMMSYMPSTDAQKEEWYAASRSDRLTQEKLTRKVFAGAGWQADRLLEEMSAADDFYFQPIRQIKMTHWAEGRVVCLGDAAFCPSPLTGQGATLALTGAYILAGELSKLTEGQHPATAFKAYEELFRPHVMKIIDGVPSFVPGIAHPETAWQRWLISCLVSTMSRVMALPWPKFVTKKFAHDDAEKDDNGFPLPHYPTLDGKTGN